MFSKKITEAQIRDIARHEARRAAMDVLSSLREQIANTPTQSDGTVTMRNLYDSFGFSEEDLRRKWK